jgi:hypothetical protein
MLGTLGHRVRTAALDFPSWGPSAGILLVLATVAAIAITNSPLGPAFEALWRQELGLSLGDGPFGGRSFIGSTTGSACARPLRLGCRHHTGSANSDGRLIEDDFAAATAAFLDKPSLDGTIEHLVVVSEPRTLGEMGEHFYRDLRGKIICELAKDFSRRPLEDIASLIADAPLETAACASPPSHNPRE